MEPPEVVDRRVTAIPDFACYLPTPEMLCERLRKKAHAWLTRKRPLPVVP